MSGPKQDDQGQGKCREKARKCRGKSEQKY